jgi:hypothetical protein
MEQLEDNLRAVNVSLTDEEQAAIAEISKIPAEYPAWMLERWSHFPPHSVGKLQTVIIYPVRPLYGLSWGGELGGVF